MKFRIEKQNTSHIKTVLQVVALLGLVILFSFLLPQLAGLFIGIPVAYFLVCRHVRGRSCDAMEVKIPCELEKVKAAADSRHGTNDCETFNRKGFYIL